jgi:hypothetical protein
MRYLESPPSPIAWLIVVAESILSQQVDSDVMIDFEMAYRNTQRRIPRPESGGGVIMSPTVEDREESYSTHILYDDAELFAAKRSLWTRDNDLLRNHTLGNLHRDIYALLPARVYGYVLLSRNWCKCFNASESEYYTRHLLTITRSARYQPCRRRSKGKAGGKRWVSEARSTRRT